MSDKPKIKKSAITRAGYEYQDLAGIEVLIRHFRDPSLFEWVELESQDPSVGALDDVVALRRDGSIEFTQVKFTVDEERYFLKWDWLLGVKGKGTSMLSKWVEAFFRAKAGREIHRAALVTNRIPSEEFSSCLRDGIVELSRLSEELLGRVEDACGGAERAREFFSEFLFEGGHLDLDRYERSLRDSLVPSDTDTSGWLLLGQHVRHWSIRQNDPEPDGKIRREHLIQLITKRRPQPIRQDFFVPDEYQIPSKAFDNSIRARIQDAETPITILWATPGRGKSTYLSYLTQELQKSCEVVLRHHYFLPSDGPRSNRMSYVDIATSLTDQLISRHPDFSAGVTRAVEKLHEDIEVAAQNLAGEGKRLYLIIDGLDHVWRDTSRTDQLDHLFNVLLPLPPNVSLIIGTQRVADTQLPAKLLTSAREADWVEVPRMDEAAVHNWFRAQATARQLVADEANNRRQDEDIAGIGAALYRVSQGHPLHLVYALESLVRRGNRITSEDVDDLPPCPDGDIRTYYRALWVRLSPTSRSILHALSGSDFFWPSLGIRQCLGEFSEVDFLLEPRNSGMIPFHQSIFAYVRELPDHAESYAALLPQIVVWLETQAPEYWRWGWLWIVQAEAGDAEPLMEGTNREWVVESLANGWSEKQISRILSAAEVRAFEAGDLPNTVRLRSLKTRILNAREFQATDYGLFRAAALLISDNRQQSLNLADDLQGLTEDEVVTLARFSPTAVRTEVASAGLQELGRRVNAWIELRHTPAHEFESLSDQLLSVAAFAGLSAVPRILRYLVGFRDPSPHCETFIERLGAAQDIPALLAVRSRLRGKARSAQRRLLQEQLLHAALFKGANAANLIKLQNEDLTPFTASWLLKAGIVEGTSFRSEPVPEDLLRERYSIGKNPDVTDYICDFFWSVLCLSLQAKGEFSVLYPSRDSTKIGWLDNALTVLEILARNIALGEQAPTFAAVYDAADALESQEHLDPNNRDAAQYRAFKQSLPKIALRLHLYGLEDQHQVRISSADFQSARQSLHWNDELWLLQNVSNQLAVIDHDAAQDFVAGTAANLANQVTEFNERAERWTQLAVLAALYDVDSPTTLIQRAANCLMGYGWRKDLGASDVIDAVQQVHSANPETTGGWLRALAPIVDEITSFTDGDETDHVRSDLISAVGEVRPDYLAAFYAHHIAVDEWRYADETLEAALQKLDLTKRATEGLVSTLLDDRTLGALQKRAKEDDVAKRLVLEQYRFLGRQAPEDDTGSAQEDDLTAAEKEALKQDPTAIGPNDFDKLIGLTNSTEFPYRHREEFLAKWLEHWREKGKARAALGSIREAIFREEGFSRAEEILDYAFKVSLDEEGKEAAYEWLVRAHIYRHGWQSNWTSETEVIKRLTLAAEIYPERWQEYIQDTSKQPPYYRRLGYRFTIGHKYLVRYLLLVGQAEIAKSVTNEFVQTLISEVSDQPILPASWLKSADIEELAIDLLFERLNWPVPMVRWRAARAICDLLESEETRELTRAAYLRSLENCVTESETCALLTILQLTAAETRPAYDEVSARLSRPSVLSNMLLHQIYGREDGGSRWTEAHSGQVPAEYEATPYFEEHKTAQVPPVLENNLRRLERRSGLPFHQQWAFEWKQLCDRYRTRFTRYPYYFDSYAGVRDGIVGQYLQRQGEIYRSAYLRVLAIAVDEWEVPENVAKQFAVDITPAIDGLFQLSPIGRPVWLGDFPERCLDADGDLDGLVHELVKAGSSDDQRLVCLRTPFREDTAPYGDLAVSAFFISDDFQLHSDEDLYEPPEVVPLNEVFSLSGRTLRLEADDLRQQGTSGFAIPVCVALLPMPYGYWHNDYFSTGLCMPSGYFAEDQAVFACQPQSVELHDAGQQFATTQFWHDAWTPLYHKDGSTRIGMMSQLHEARLTSLKESLGLRLAWFVKWRVWKRKTDYGAFEHSERRALIMDEE